MAPKKKLYKRNRRPVNFAPWKPSDAHVHNFVEAKKQVSVTSYILLDRCTECPYEVARDLIVESHGEVN